MRRIFFAAFFSLAFGCLAASDLDVKFKNRSYEFLAGSGLPCRSIPLKDHSAIELFEDGAWKLYDLYAKTVFLSLDNETLASVDDIAFDPFLAIRVKIASKTQVDPIKSLEYFAHFDILNKNSLEEFHQNDFRAPQDNFQASTDRKVSIVNPEPVLSGSDICFQLSGIDSSCNELYWQIGQSLDFPEAHPLISNFEGIQEAKETVNLDLMTASFFNPETIYYFRAKAKDQEGWSEWSSPFAFQVKKPSAVIDAKFEGDQSEGYRLKWDSRNPQGTRYLIFASNCLDFIPSIYCPFQVNAIADGEMISSEANKSLIAETDETEIQIDQSYAFYRIIAAKDGIYSTPSPIIRFFDEGVSLRRTVLQAQAEKIERIALPSVQANQNTFDLITDRAARPSGINDEVWNKVTPYLMPDNHPVKESLDRIFKTYRATSTKAAMHDAGFKDIRTGPFSHVTIARHKRLHGYLVKLFRDDQFGLQDWEQCVRRAAGAKAVRAAIALHRYSGMMKAPRKWIYALPDNPPSWPGLDRKHFILVVEEMDILRSSSSHYQWKSPHIPRYFIEAVAHIINDVGLNDTTHDFNMPFCRDGRIAFIDTEHNHKWPIPWGILRHTLHPTVRVYLDSYLNSRGIN